MVPVITCEDLDSVKGRWRVGRVCFLRQTFLRLHIPLSFRHVTPGNKEGTTWDLLIFGSRNRERKKLSTQDTTSTTKLTSVQNPHRIHIQLTEPVYCVGRVDMRESRTAHWSVVWSCPVRPVRILRFWPYFCLKRYGIKTKCLPGPYSRPMTYVKWSLL